jgi:hypothetical protein
MHINPWQPINTAPTDKLILLYAKKYETGTYKKKEYREYTSEEGSILGFFDGQVWRGSHGVQLIYMEPVAWMEIPKYSGEVT